MKNEDIENEYIRLKIEDGILYGDYKSDLDIDIDAANTIVRDRLAICNGKNFPHVLNIAGIKKTSKEARDYFSKDKGIMYMSCMALITDSPLSRTIGNFFLFFNKPLVPTRLFTNLSEAKQWAESFLKPLQKA